MKLILVLTLTIATVAAIPLNDFVPVKNVLGLSSRIISGKPAERGQFKYQAIVLHLMAPGQGYFCGGSLMNSGWILTAAHCIGSKGATYVIELGALRSDGIPENGKKSFQATRAIVHKNYNSLDGINDIALIDLQTKVEFSDVIQPIALSKEDVDGKAKLTVNGWGKTSDTATYINLYLSYVSITSITNKKCKEVWGANIIDGSLCCVGSPEHSPCEGDTGGPLVKYNGNGEPEQVGVVSYSHRNGCASGNPFVFVRTKYYAQWIANTMKS